MNTMRPLDTLWQDLRYRGATCSGATRALPSPPSCRSRWASARIPRSSSCSTPCACGRCRSRNRGSLVNVSFARGSMRSGRFLEPLAGIHVRAVRADPGAAAGVLEACLRGAAARSTPRSGGEVKMVEDVARPAASFPGASRQACDRARAPAGRRPARLRVAGRRDQPRLLAARLWRIAGGAAADRAARRACSSPIVGVTEPSFFGLDVGRRFDVAVPLCADRAAAGRRQSPRVASRVVAGGDRTACARADARNRPMST